MQRGRWRHACAKFCPRRKNFPTQKLLNLLRLASFLRVGIALAASNRVDAGANVDMLGPKWESVGTSGKKMLLTGTFPRTIDEKQRLAIPKRLREALAKSAPGTERGKPPGGKKEHGSEDPRADGEEESGVLYVAPGTDGSLSDLHGGIFPTTCRAALGQPPNRPGRPCLQPLVLLSGAAA